MLKNKFRWKKGYKRLQKGLYNRSSRFLFYQISGGITVPWVESHFSPSIIHALIWMIEIQVWIFTYNNIFLVGQTFTKSAEPDDITCNYYEQGKISFMRTKGIIFLDFFNVFFQRILDRGEGICRHGSVNP